MAEIEAAQLLRLATMLAGLMAFLQLSFRPGDRCWATLDSGLVGWQIACAVAAVVVAASLERVQSLPLRLMVAEESWDSSWPPAGLAEVDLAEAVAIAADVAGAAAATVVDFVAVDFADVERAFAVIAPEKLL